MRDIRFFKKGEIVVTDMVDNGNYIEKFKLYVIKKG